MSKDAAIVANSKSKSKKKEVKVAPDSKKTDQMGQIILSDLRRCRSELHTHFGTKTDAELDEKISHWNYPESRENINKLIARCRNIQQTMARNK